MNLDKNSKLVKFEVYAEAYYSNAKAYGELYVPEEILEKYHYPEENLVTYIHELDGKHSETRADIVKITGTLGEFVEKGRSVLNPESDQDESLDEEIAMAYHFNKEDYAKIKKLNREIQEMMKTTTTTVKLTEDITIEGVLVSKGSSVTYTTREVVEDASIEL